MDLLWRPEFGTSTIERGRLLGRGAFGEVFLVRARPSDGRATLDCSRDPSGCLLALKRSSLANVSEIGKERAIGEAKLLQRLGFEHRHILRCFDFRLVSGREPYLELLLEFAPLGDLSSRIRAHREAQLLVGGTAGMAEAEALAYGRDVASGLAYLHALRPKIFHRDVKPANIVLFLPHQESNLPCAKLADFGIAKIFEHEGSFADAKTVIGTPHYFSPEICNGEAYDERSDAWALGCVLYELLCLHRPFHLVEHNLAQLAIRISRGQFDHEALMRCSARYNGLFIFTLLGLLTADPGQRLFASAAAESLGRLAAELSGGIAHLDASCQPWWTVQPTESFQCMTSNGTGHMEATAAPPFTLGRVASVSDSWANAESLLVDALATDTEGASEAGVRSTAATLREADGTMIPGGCARSASQTLPPFLSETVPPLTMTFGKAPQSAPLSVTSLPQHRLFTPTLSAEELFEAMPTASAPTTLHPSCPPPVSISPVHTLDTVYLESEASVTPPLAAASRLAWGGSSIGEDLPSVSRTRDDNSFSRTECFGGTRPSSGNGTVGGSSQPGCILQDQARAFMRVLQSQRSGESAGAVASDCPRLFLRLLRSQSSGEGAGSVATDGPVVFCFTPSVASRPRSAPRRACDLAGSQRLDTLPEVHPWVEVDLGAGVYSQVPPRECLEASPFGEDAEGFPEFEPCAESSEARGNGAEVLRSPEGFSPTLDGSLHSATCEDVALMRAASLSRSGQIFSLTSVD